ncbi:MAG: MipA/OmpV family protein [Sphingomonadales bacterium]|nr:MipA/OmpV family protein [Sphingomonadales bacterium]PIX67185.1 MAG: structural protein MipA [Sphingomonadales bacterium CG_4_10_14_3_um_filter_58_15]NCO50098.1 MipA/OmpV family protein [Sphingomonadales bacterium]NCO99533.1 MipA/OmpV family protein [Sphingomonadales bacterium]NCP27661.1 MipA/OmpV family protein [Sphingomonadales bacterium]
MSSPLLAQEDPAPVPPEQTVFDGDYLTAGIGVAVGASYEGSDDYTISPLPVVLGSFGGIDFQPRGPGIAFDLIPDQEGAKVDFIFGPVVRARFDRQNSIKDPVVRSLGKLDVAVEVGPFAGIQVNRVLNPYDSLTAQVDVRWDVAGAHDGMVVFPSLTYFTPLSRGVVTSLSVNGEYVDDDYADYYFSISPAGLAASGLPTFTATSGWKNVGATVLTGVDLDGDVTNGGFSLIFLGSYSRMLGDPKRSPVTSIRGSANQFFGAIGVGYTF